MEFYVAEKKKELIPFATAWMELESIMLSEVSQVVKDKYHITSPYKCNLMNKTNKQAKYNQWQWNEEQTISNQRGGGKG